jgi:tetratricopeptide (TPR) repeat protein
MSRIITCASIVMVVIVFSPRVMRGDDPKKLTDQIKTIRGELYLIPRGKNEGDKRLLKNIILHIDHTTEDKATNESGVFELEFVEPKRAGQDIYVKVLSPKDELVIYYPDYKGRLRLPQKGQDVQVIVGYKDDKFRILNQCLVQVVEDAADANAKAPRMNGADPSPDFPGELKRLARELKLTEKEVTDRFNEWLVEAKNSKDARTLEAFAFAQKNYSEAINYALRRASPGNESAGDYALAGGLVEDAIQYYSVALKPLDKTLDIERFSSISYKLALVKGAYYTNGGESKVSSMEITFAIQYFRKRLETLNPKAERQAIADTEANLARLMLVQAERGVGEQIQRQLDDAIQHNLNALKTVGHEKNPAYWASIMNNLGNSYRVRGVYGTNGRNTTTNFNLAITKFKDVLNVVSRDQHPLSWANTSDNLGNTHRAKGERTDGAAGINLLHTAINNHREALACTPLQHSLMRAGMLHNLGSSLFAYGERLNDQQTEEKGKILDNAVAAFIEASNIRTRERFPLAWATTQNDLGITYYTKALTVRESKTHDSNALLTKAISAFKNALEVFTLEHFPANRATALVNIGNVFYEQGSRETNREKREELCQNAVKSYEEALALRGRIHGDILSSATTKYHLGKALFQAAIDSVKPQAASEFLDRAILMLRETIVIDKNDYPRQWANAQSLLGDVLYHQSVREKNEAKKLTTLGDSAKAYSASQDVFKFATHPTEWEVTTNNLGIVLYQLGMSTKGDDGIKILLKAIAKLREVLEVRTKTKTKNETEWAITGSNLGNALFQLGSRLDGEESVKLLNEAVILYHDIITVRTKEKDPKRWAVIQKNLKEAERLLLIRK